jgi:CRISPR system Cascade subunit CasA
MNTLTAPLIRYTSHAGLVISTTLPGVFAAAMRDEVTSFVALRPHQRHAWHAFLAQLGTVALLRAGLPAPPDEESAWRDLLRNLTPEYPDDAPWCLVAPPDRPALLQPPLAGGDASGLKNSAPTPDSLDMLITSKNHDLKAGVMVVVQPDDWLFALVTLQTMEGFLGSGNYGVSRMNGGFANRPALGLAPPGGPGAHLRRDIKRLLAMGGRPPLSEGCAEQDGLVLVWLRSWDGTTSLSRSELHPLYIEICRRVRLFADKDERITARVGGSKVPRIAPMPKGVTGDPWTPIRRDKEGQKALTVDVRGFSYGPLVELLWPRNGDLSALQDPAADDAEEGLALVARALVRGQGKTEGYHERRVPISRKVRRRLGGSQATDRVAEAAHERVKLAGEVNSALRFALLALFENGPDKVDSQNKAALGKAEVFLARLERAVDQTFFEDLWREVDADDAEAGYACRAAWVQRLLNLAEGILEEADGAASKAVRRRYRARVRARSALHGAARSPKGSLASLLQAAKAADVPA